MSYEFAGSLFQNLNEAESACVKTFLCGGGQIDIMDSLESLNDLAEEMVENWNNAEGNEYTLDEAVLSIQDALLEIMAEDVMGFVSHAKSLQDFNRRVKMVMDNPYCEGDVDLQQFESFCW